MDLSSISRSVVKMAADIGASMSNNVTIFVRSKVPQTLKGTPSFFHAKNQRQREGVQELGDSAITWAIAGLTLQRAMGSAEEVESRGLIFSLYAGFIIIFLKVKLKSITTITLIL